MVGTVTFLLLAGCGVGSTGTSTITSTTSSLIANLQPYATAQGTVSTYSTGGSIDPSGVFFQALGTNGRTCASCHQLASGMSLSATAVQALFASSGGADPLFDAVDGANCPTVAAGNQAGRSLLLQNGLIRIAVTLPSTAQFTLSVVQDPYGCALANNLSTGTQTVSVYRRPLPTTNLPYLSSVMWDTRETVAALTSASTLAANLDVDLTAQALSAVATHEQGSTVPTSAQQAALVSFEKGLFTAEASNGNAGSLSGAGATGGALALASSTYYPSINDAFGGDPTGAAFNPNVFSLYGAWNNSNNATQASIANGEHLFNTAPLRITNVRGINDNAALGNPAVFQGSCSTCHDTPNVGHHSAALALDIGVVRQAADETDPNILAGLAQLNAPLLPVYKIAGCKDVKNNPVTYYTSDPGAGLVTGLCADVNRVKVPIPRGLAARAPYFHNGSATDLPTLVRFYNARFQMNLNPQQQTDLVNFLNSL